MLERLNKVIAASGLVSRRGADELIKNGQVIVDGHKISDLATQVDPKVNKITVGGKPLLQVKTITYALNKPVGVVTSTLRQKEEKIVTDFVPAFPKVVPIGRLDKESEGLLLMTNDGDLAQRLTHPKFEHRKEYRTAVKFQKNAKPLTIEQILKELKKGVRLGDGKAVADKAEAKELPDGKIILYITVHEGRTHLIRRMCATLGLDVVSLKRQKIASIELGNLKPGQFRPLKPEELTALRQ